MDPIKDMLDSSRFQKPDEVEAIKNYIYEKYNVAIEVLVRASDIVVIAKSASLANSIRFELPHLQQLSKSKKKILIRISG